MPLLLVDDINIIASSPIFLTFADALTKFWLQERKKFSLCGQSSSVPANGCLVGAVSGGSSSCASDSVTSVQLVDSVVCAVDDMCSRAVSMLLLNKN